MILTPRKAIRAKCLDCCCGHPSEVRDCTATNCPLYPHRFGKRPKAGEDTTQDGTAENTAVNPNFPTAEAKKESPLA